MRARNEKDISQRIKDSAQKRKLFKRKEEIQKIIMSKRLLFTEKIG